MIIFGPTEKFSPIKRYLEKVKNKYDWVDVKTSRLIDIALCNACSVCLLAVFTLEIVQKSKQEEMDRKKVEDRRRKEGENVGGVRESLGVKTKEEWDEKVIEQ